MVVTADALVAQRGRFTLEIGSFAAGESGTAVLGPNGAGKTTLLLALQGLIPAMGAVRRPARCAAVFARPAVLRGTALWNVAAIARDVLRVGAADAVARAHAVLDEVGLGATATADARTLSTGQRQRLALARALACEPQALFLDEPFANIDADARPLLRAAVASYAKRTGCAVVLVTSSFADAAALCGAAVVLRAGRMVHSGSLEQLRHSEDPYATALLAEAGQAPE